MSAGDRIVKGRRILRAVLAAVLLAVFVLPAAVLTAILHHHVDYRGNMPLKEVYSVEAYGLQETVHTLRTTDGEEVWCAEVAAERPKGVILWLAGITKPSVTQFYGHAVWLREEGFASFLLEVRAHGSSTGNQIGLGYTEVEDVRTTVEYIKSCPDYQDVPLVIWGVSMGGAIALNAFGQLEEIDGCIAMSPYASFPQVADQVMRQYGVPTPIRAIENALMEPLLNTLYGREAVAELTPENQIQNADGRSVFLVACQDDRTVPVENTLILQEKAPEAMVWIRDSGDHFVVKDNDFSAVTEDAEYCQKMLVWLENVVAAEQREQ